MALTQYVFGRVVSQRNVAVETHDSAAQNPLDLSSELGFVSKLRDSANPVPGSALTGTDRTVLVILAGTITSS